MYYRVNSLRVSPRELISNLKAKYEDITPIKWYPEAFKSEHNLSKSIYYQLGYIYIQSLSSMIPPLILSPKPGEKVLDMAAAPGSKTTQLAIMMSDQGTLIANDSSYMRIKSLASHIDRLGITNTIITNLDGRRIPKKVEFDKILLDAPCSSHGSRKGCRVEFSEKRIKSLAKLQKSLLLHAIDLVKKGGEIVYSTCTTTYEENEGVIEHILEKREVKLMDIKLPFKAVTYNGKYIIQRDEAIIYPGQSENMEINTKIKRFHLDEDFFIAKLRRL